MKINLQTIKKIKYLIQKLFILLGIITIVSLGVWDYYYNNGTGGAGGTQAGTNVFPGNPPAPTASNPTPQTISIIDNQTEVNRLIPPISRYEGPISPSIGASTDAWGGSSPINNTPILTETLPNTYNSSTSAWGSNEATTSNTSPTHPNPRLARDYDRLFQKPEGSTYQAGGSS